MPVFEFINLTIMDYTLRTGQSRLLAILVVSLASQIVSGLVSIAHAAPPAYDVQFIGGFPKAVNNAGDAVGWILDNGISRGWVFEDGSRTLLPVPAGWHSQANDINDNGVIVGNAGSDAGPTGPVLWQPNGNGYDMTVINTPVDDEFGAATAINNFSDIVGTRTFMSEIRPGVTTQITRGFLYSSSGVLTPNLSDSGFAALPTDINDNGQIVGGQLRMTQSLVEDLGVPTVPPNETGYILTFINAINNTAQVAAQTALATSSTFYTASRYSDGSGWQVLTLQGSFDAGLGINNGGDVTFEASFFCASGAGKPGVYLQGEGNSYCLDDLLADASWQLNGPFHESDINNSGQILVHGGNTSLGVSGAVLLTPDGAVAVPADPQNLAATVVPANATQPTNRVQLSWTDASDNETGFRVERKLAGNSTWGAIITLNAGTQAYNDNSVDFDQIYEYRVFATGLAGDSAASNVVTAVSPPAPPVAPAAPQGLTATVVTAASGNRVQLSWTDASDNETGFRVERRLSSSSTWNTIATPAAGSTAYEDNTVEFDETYDYRVFAIGDAGDSTASNVVTAVSPPAPPVAPVAPQGLTATVVTAASGNRVQLSWTDASDNETGFRVERRISSSSAWNAIATPAADSTAYQDSTIDFDETYDYRVFATGLAGDSAASNVMTAVSPPAPPVVPLVPVAPQGLTATVVADSGGNLVQLNWTDASDNETGFGVERRLSGSSTWNAIATSVAGSTTYQDSTVDFDETYEYRVLAFGNAGDSVASNMVTAVSPEADQTTGAGSFDLISMFLLMLFAGIFRRKIR